MGIFKAAKGAVGGALADQWLEAFTCDALDVQTLVLRGHKMQSSRSANNGDDNVISAGSAILVPDGTAAIVTEMGKVLACYDTPGEHTFTGNQAAGVFGGGLSSLAKDVGRRFTFGGDVPVVQRVYFINTKECYGNPFICRTGVRLRDAQTTLDMDASVAASGVFAYRIADPVLFYKCVSGNVAQSFTRDELSAQLAAELCTVFAPALADVCAAGVRPYALPEHLEEICAAVQKHINEKWLPTRGLEMISFALESLTVTQEDQSLVQQMQRAKVLTDPAMAAATLTGALADALPAAAANTGGAMAAALLHIDTAPKFWVCKCGQYNTGRFCESCGTPRS